MIFANITLILFLIMDPIGNVSSYLKLMHEIPSSARRRIVFREMLIALAFMLGFSLIGEYIFDFLGLGSTTVRLASGLILFLIAIKILFTSSSSPRMNLPEGEPFIFPLAIPLVAGPGVLATIMLYSNTGPFQGVMIPAIILAWFLSTLILYFSETIKRLLGKNGLMACERLVGMVLVLVAVQRIMDGILAFAADQAAF